MDGCFHCILGVPLLVLVILIILAIDDWFRPRPSYVPDGVCDQCGYDLRGSAGLYCPECGGPRRPAALKGKSVGGDACDQRMHL